MECCAMAEGTHWRFTKKWGESVKLRARFITNIFPKESEIFGHGSRLISPRDESDMQYHMLQMQISHLKHFIHNASVVRPKVDKSFFSNLHARS